MITLNGTLDITPEKWQEVLDLTGSNYTPAEPTPIPDSTKMRNAFVTLAGEDFVANLGL